MGDQECIVVILFWRLQIFGSRQFCSSWVPTEVDRSETTSEWSEPTLWKSYHWGPDILVFKKQRKMCKYVYYLYAYLSNGPIQYWPFVIYMEIWIWGNILCIPFRRKHSCDKVITNTYEEQQNVCYLTEQNNDWLNLSDLQIYNGLFGGWGIYEVSLI